MLYLEYVKLHGPELGLAVGVVSDVHKVPNLRSIDLLDLEKNVITHPGAETGVGWGAKVFYAREVCAHF